MYKYEVIAIIDEGAYGIVYKVRNKDNNRTCKDWWRGRCDEAVQGPNHE